MFSAFLIYTSFSQNRGDKMKANKTQRILYYLTTGILLILFNNCGQGFKAVEGINLSTEGQNSPTPIPTPVPSPSVSPTPRPSATPTSTPRPSPSPNPTPASTPTPSPTPVFSPSPTPTATPIPGGTNISNGQSVSVTGTNFGTKAQAAPVVFDDFESGTLGSRIEGMAAVVGAWLRGDWSYAITYNNSRQLQGNKVAKHAFTPTDYNASLYTNRSTQTVYMDFWMRVDPKSAALTRNFKAWRVYAPNDVTVGNEVVFCDSPGWTGIDSGLGGYIDRDRRWNNWEHYEVIIKLGANGIFAQYRDGIADVNKTGNNSNATITEIRIGHYWASDPDANCPSNPGADVYTDLVYVDTSLARVVLGNASTFAGSTQRAIQRPTAWSNGSVSYVANTFGFASGQTVYEFVIDANNAVRSTRQLRVQ